MNSLLANWLFSKGVTNPTLADIEEAEQEMDDLLDPEEDYWFEDYA